VLVPPWENAPVYVAVVLKVMVVVSEVIGLPFACCLCTVMVAGVPAGVDEGITVKTNVFPVF
jgi:hypothetical protein